MTIENQRRLFVVVDVFLIALNLWAAFWHFSLFSIFNIFAVCFVSWSLYWRTKRTGQWDDWMDWLNRRRVAIYLDLKARGYLK